MEPLNPRFLAETTGHRMQILFDQGLYRHLRAAAPGSSGYWFDLISTPNALTFRGDGQTYCFAHAEPASLDIFEMFRAGIRPGGELGVNPGYWATKLTTDRSSVRHYSQDAFTAYTTSLITGAAAENPGVAEAWDEHVNDPLGYFNTEVESDAREAMATFEFGTRRRMTCSCGDSVDYERHGLVPRRWAAQHVGPFHQMTGDVVDGFRFPRAETAKVDFVDFDWWFLFACSAIVWGVAKYDAHKRLHRGGRARHKVVFSHGGVHQEIEHPAECDWLRYGELCDFEQAIELGEFDPATPVTSGAVWARAAGSHDHAPLEECGAGCRVIVVYEEPVEDEPRPNDPRVLNALEAVALAAQRGEVGSWASPEVSPWTAARRLAPESNGQVR